MASEELPRVRRTAPNRRRLPGWPERLAALIEERRSQAFEWGAHDCCTFAADAAAAITGDDPMAAYRGLYDSEEGAAGMIGPGGLEERVAADLGAWGAPEIPPAFAQRGDWALVPVGNELMSGVVLGATIAVPGRDGLKFLPLNSALRCWGV